MCTHTTHSAQFLSSWIHQCVYSLNHTWSSSGHKNIVWHLYLGSCSSILLVLMFCSLCPAHPLSVLQDAQELQLYTSNVRVGSTEWCYIMNSLEYSSFTKSPENSLNCEHFRWAPGLWADWLTLIWMCEKSREEKSLREKYLLLSKLLLNSFSLLLIV